ncbi:hypothetical protein [Acinetobacter sp. YH01009]|uniref:hypothetical protein n=1 Tax=Acinetobacter TaxID=469 RepID=UPI0015D39048
MNKKSLSVAILTLLLAGCDKAKDNITPPEDQIDPIEKKVEDQVRQYDERVTTYKPNNYKLPVTKPSAIDQKVSCKFGIGGTIPKLTGTSFFNQVLYRIEAEQIMDKVQGDVMYAPYSIATSVEGDVLYESEIDSFDRQLNTLRSYQIKSIDQNIISTGGFYTNSNNAVRMQPIRSYPVAYVKRMDNDIVSTSMFNDDCDKEVGVRNYKWREIDISGKPISSITSTVSEQIVRVNQFGMFTSASNFFSYFSNEFGNYINSNYKFKNELQNAGRFPKGSKIYVPSEIKTTDETLVIMQNPEFEISNFNKERVLDAYNKEAKSRNLGKITFKVYELKNQAIFYTPWNETQHREAIEFDPVVVIKGKAYSAVWHVPNTLTFNDSTSAGSLTYYNSTAHNAFVNAVKGIYQGQQSMIGTAHEDDTQYSMKTAIDYQKSQAEN